MSEGLSMTGRLLVATPAIEEPTFHRTVVLLVAHGDEGALGVVLNRPSATPVEEILPEWAAAAASPAVVFVGGPVAGASAIGLGRARDVPPGSPWSPIVGPVGAVDLDQPPADLGGHVQEVRVFAGYAGWAGGQLEAEIADGGWWVVDSLPGDAFTPDPEALWRVVLRRQGGTLARVATFPPDLRLN